MTNDGACIGEAQLASRISWVVSGMLQLQRKLCVGGTYRTPFTVSDCHSGRWQGTPLCRIRGVRAQVVTCPHGGLSKVTVLFTALDE
jgi:hypothetical protein